MTDETNMLRQLRSNGNPVIGSGKAVICWEGEDPPQLLADHIGWNRDQAAQMSRLSERLWVYQAELPADSYIEYAFCKGDERIIDPHNPQITPNGLGQYNNYFSMPEYRSSTWHHKLKGIPQGEISKMRLPSHGLVTDSSRTVHLYHPPVDYPVPLVIVYDGNEYLQRTRLPVIMDNLIAAGKIQPLALAMINNSKRYRFMEYSCADATLFYLLEVVLPYAHHNLNLIDIDTHPGAYGILGASLGGLMALYTLLRLPKIFGRGLCQAGAYSVEGFDFPVWDLLEGIRGTDARIWMDCGRFDWLIEANRRMASVLSDLAIPFHFHEINAGHNYPTWRDCLPHGLEFLYPSNAS